MEKSKRSLKEIALKAFDVMDHITGIETGGIEAPRVLIAAEAQDDGSVAITWKHPKTCGLSDVRYHYIDVSPHTDIYTIDNGTLLVNGKNPFADLWLDECRKEAERFREAFGLTA